MSDRDIGAEISARIQDIEDFDGRYLRGIAELSFIGDPLRLPFEAHYSTQLDIQLTLYKGESPVLTEWFCFSCKKLDGEYHGLQDIQKTVALLVRRPVLLFLGERDRFAKQGKKLVGATFTYIITNQSLQDIVRLYERDRGMFLQ